ncbi:5'-methylthioadenosine/S-adenosylhomocysteine nucleosidase [Roseivivax sp. THAF40]|uniref:phosphorylase family protein n=1 Tax=unclassified Roseivivax TaxID=2639302 RepID=UPI001267EEE3|nr:MULTISPECIES: hypothetical protein [unclassified Roseivivax]QFS84609.1 5'-methylthioadenosine/S-adenosylhomocysteine nucleosidase [Roseivivax sp. THAF197b]QFT48436.1 5'-methylthioadenosine/S-adenosylhomocysteine nucleosidase [Roseivivax sp. THAF40]
MAVKKRDVSAQEEYDIEDCDVLIFTAIEDLEAHALTNHLKRVGAVYKEQTKAERLKDLHRWSLPRNHDVPELRLLTRCLQRAGNGYSGIELSHLLHTQHRPKLVVFCGIGGSLDVKEAQLGNVIVSSNVNWKGFDKISGDSVSKEMRKISLDEHPVNERLQNLVKSFIRDNNAATDAEAPARGLFKTDRDSGFWSASERWLGTAKADADLRPDIENFEVHQYYDRVKPIVRLGKVMSWDFVLNKKSIREEVKNDDKEFLVVEMETGGMALAARRAREHFRDSMTEVMAVRGISDLCNKKTDDVFRELAADHAAAFLIGFLQSGYDEEF